MLNFLKQTRKFLNSKDLVCIVIGNESCDLDSAVCAINLAFLYSQHGKLFNNIKIEKFLPVLNVPRADYELKTEVKYVLNQHGIEAPDLTFRDELQEDFVQNCQHILVDHHASTLATRCLNIFDHRPRDTTVFIPENCEVYMENVGSCATLIAEQFLQAGCIGELFKSNLTMLKDTIILDTVNFSESAARATPKDHAICEQLEQILETTAASRVKIFDDLVRVRADVNKLSAAQLLRKDLKILSNKKGDLKVALPGFPTSVQEFMQRPDALKDILELANIQKINVILLMGFKVLEDGSVKRDIGLIDIDKCKLWMTIRDELLQSIRLDLKLIKLDCSYMKKGCFYQQENLERTRKHILPIIKNILDSQGAH